MLFNARFITVSMASCTMAELLVMVPLVNTRSSLMFGWKALPLLRLTYQGCRDPAQPYWNYNLDSPRNITLRQIPSPLLNILSKLLQERVQRVQLVFCGNFHLTHSTRVHQQNQPRVGCDQLNGWITDHHGPVSLLSSKRVQALDVRPEGSTPPRSIELWIVTFIRNDLCIDSPFCFI